MKKLLTALAIAGTLVACNNDADNKKASDSTAITTTQTTSTMSVDTTHKMATDTTKKMSMDTSKMKMKMDSTHKK